jgi:putative nucleotidyltransferase with HDIG domain
MQHIVLTSGGPVQAGKRWEFTTSFRVGSDSDAEISWPDPSLRPHHTEVRASELGWICYHLGTAETRVNGDLVGIHGRRLRLDDLIECGVLSLRVSALQDPGTTIITDSGVLEVEAIAQKSWQKALEGLATPESSWPQSHRHLLTLFRAGYHLRQVARLPELTKAILDDTVAVLEAQRGCILLADELTGKLELHTVVTTHKSLSAAKCYSQSIVRRSFEHDESLLCQDVTHLGDPRSVQSSVRKNMASIICVLLRTPRKKLGVLHLDRGPTQEPFSREQFSLADAIAASVSAAIEISHLIAEQRNLYFQSLAALARTVNLRDQYTGDHTRRVTDYSLMLAQEMGLSLADQEALLIGTPLHDIGKIGVEDAILQKPSKLSPHEFDVMKTHVIRGGNILETIPNMASVIPIVRHHHERWDGTGYPDGLSGEQIPLLARIVGVADAFDAMTSDRPYRPALSLMQAFNEIEAKSGSHFDPACAQAFLRLRWRIDAGFPRGGHASEDIDI